MHECVASYIGLPYKILGRDKAGLDCWGLVRLFYKQELGKSLPILNDDYSNAENRSETSQVVTRNLCNWVQKTAPKNYDVILMKMAGEPCHVGVVVDTEKQIMLHIERGIDSCIENYGSFKWQNRIVGFFRLKTNAEHS